METSFNLSNYLTEVSSALTIALVIFIANYTLKSYKSDPKGTLIRGYKVYLSVFLLLSIGEFWWNYHYFVLDKLHIAAISLSVGQFFGCVTILFVSAIRRKMDIMENDISELFKFQEKFKESLSSPDDQHKSDTGSANTS